MSVEAETTESPTADALLASARALAPLLEARSAETEARGTYSRELHDAFVEAGIYRSIVPRRYGGYELSLKESFRVQLELARGDLATAWNVSLGSNHALQVASWFPERAQEELFGTDGGFRAAATAAPQVTATRVEDGWSLEGTVNYCSGTTWATHFVGQAMIAEPGAPAGPPRMLMYVAPRTIFEVLDDWGHTTGLRGTGSNSIRFDGGVIPAHHALQDAFMIDYPAENGTAGYALHGNPLYAGRSMAPFTMSLSVLLIGGAYGILDEFEKALKERKTMLPPFTPRVEDDDYLRWYGAAAAKVQTAEAATLNALDQWEEACRRNVSGERPFTYADDVRIAAIAREAMVLLWETVQGEVHRHIGSSLSVTGQRYERLFRDFTMAAGHRNTSLRELHHRTIGKSRAAGDYER